jgi:HEAT repeat protein
MLFRVVIRTWLAWIVVISQNAPSTGQDAKKRPPAWEERDILGRPIPWGKEVGGQRVCLWIPATRLLYGQPIDVLLRTAQATHDPPHLTLNWEGPHRTVFFEWTDELGHAITYVRQSGGQGQALEGNFEHFRLQPTENFARGRYLVPGKYWMRVVIDAKRWPRYPAGWVGRAESNILEFVVLESDAGGRAELVPKEIREAAAPLVKDLDDPKAQRRVQAEKALTKLGIEVLPLLEPALDSPSAEARQRATRVFRKFTQSILERHYFRQADRDQATAITAHFGEAAWKVIGANLKPDRLELWRVERAKVGPVVVIPERKPLPPDVVRRLVADLSSPQPHVRVATIRALPQTDNEEILTALVERLADDYKAFPLVLPPDDPVEVPHVPSEAASAIIWQGKPAIGPLLTFAGQEKNRPWRRRVLEILGSIGPDPRTFALVRAALDSGDGEERTGAFYALGMLGREALPDLIKLAEAGNWYAIQQLGRHGDAKGAGPVLVKLLRHEKWDIVWETIRAVENLRLREALPELKRLAQDDEREQNVQAWAISAYARMAERKDAAELLLSSLKSKRSSARGHAVLMLAEIEWRAAVPRILEMLSDSEWYVRAQADRALRGLAQRPEGVGFNAYQPQPALWRDWWKQQQ